ncbi:hypothetical protein BT69DRAFT_1235567 [Atractiella rhizophila]|nr:hypothetical protein BT69DRAFT_1235567 [Atractiella rhizophila]
MRMAALAESALVEEWLNKEDDFHLEQSRKRAEIRVRDNRAQPIDLLALNLKWSLPRGEWAKGTRIEEEEEDGGMGLDVELDEPYEIFNNLSLDEVIQLHEDIKMYLSLEKHQSCIDFWTALLVVSNSSLQRLNKERTMTARQRGENEETKSRIDALLAGKTYEQLVALQGSVDKKLASGEVIDADYWESLKDELRVWIAKAKLRDMHEVVLKNRLEQLRKRQRDDALKVQAELAAAAANMDVNMGEDEKLSAPNASASGRRTEEEREPWTEDMMPRLWSRKEVEDWRDVEIVDEAQEREKLYAQRRQVTKTRFVPMKNKPKSAYELATERMHDKELEAEAMYAAEVARGLDEEEEVFNAEEEIRGQVYSWEDKYRPRKPKYFNKVQTGYDWNKYNQTHYDTDNPPPKVVQGYKFSIFYPDLIDKRKAPTYKTIKEKGNDDTCILLFQAGPPYEDIAFRIVNREWALGKKSGFRSSFDRGVLQLHINFKRHFYRK